MSVVDHDPDEHTLVVDRRTGTLEAGDAVLDAPGRRRDDFPPDELAPQPAAPSAAPVQTERLSAFKAARKFLAFVIVGTLVGLSASAVATRILGYEGLSVLSGSMAPSIRTGDVIINNRIRPMEARVGNIITFKDPQAQDRLITHRIQAIEHRGKNVYFETKGDANNTVENWRVDERDRLGRAIAHVPRMGFALGWLGTPVGRIGFIIVPAVLLGFLELVRIWRAPSPTTDEPEITSPEPKPTEPSADVPVQLVLEPQTTEIAAVEPQASDVAPMEPPTTEIAAVDLEAVEPIRPGDVAWFVSPVVEIADAPSEPVTTVIDAVAAEPVAAVVTVDVEAEPAVERPRRPMSTPVRRTPPKRGNAAAARARRARAAHEAARVARVELRAAEAAAAAAAAEVEAAAAAALAAQPAAAEVVAEALAASAVVAEPVVTPVAPAPAPSAADPTHGIPVPQRNATAAVPALVGLAVIGILSARRKRGR